MSGPAKWRQHPVRFWFARVALGMAMLTCAYLAWRSLTGNQVYGCGGRTACAEVLRSRWAYWFGVPVTFPAVGVYGILMMAALLGEPRKRGRFRDLAWAAALPLCVTVVMAACWFILVQAVLVKSFCVYCLTAHACGMAGAIVLLLNSPRFRSQAAGSVAPPRAPVPRSVPLALLGGIAGLAGLVAGQVLASPLPAFTARHHVAATMVVQRDVSGQVLLHDGTFRFNLRDWPVLGPPGAPRLVISLFSYTCPHCREMHRRLADARSRLGDGLAILCLPVPLTRECNPLVELTRRPHQDSCDLAQLALALASVDAAAFAQFDAWVFQSERPPPLAHAREKAAQLIGPDRLRRALAAEAIQRQIQTTVGLYEANWRASGLDELPQMIVNDALVIGLVQRPEELAWLIQGHRRPNFATKAAP